MTLKIKTLIMKTILLPNLNHESDPETKRKRNPRSVHLNLKKEAKRKIKSKRNKRKIGINQKKSLEKEIGIEKETKRRIKIKKNKVAKIRSNLKKLKFQKWTKRKK